MNHHPRWGRAELAHFYDLPDPRPGLPPACVRAEKLRYRETEILPKVGLTGSDQLSQTWIPRLELFLLPFGATEFLPEPLKTLPKEVPPLLSGRFSAASCGENSLSKSLSWPAVFPPQPLHQREQEAHIFPPPYPPHLTHHGFPLPLALEAMLKVWRQCSSVSSGSQVSTLLPNPWFPPVSLVCPRSPPGGHLRPLSHIWFQFLCQTSLSSPGHFLSLHTWSPGLPQDSWP